MIKTIVLFASLILNGLFTYDVFLPANDATTVDRMTCEQARSDDQNKIAVDAYAEGSGFSLSKVHEYLSVSDYALRNIAVKEGKVTFVYTSSVFYPSACGIHLPGIDGGIVRVETDISSDPKVVAVR